MHCVALLANGPEIAIDVAVPTDGTQRMTPTL